MIDRHYSPLFVKVLMQKVFGLVQIRSAGIAVMQSAKNFLRYDPLCWLLAHPPVFLRDFRQKFRQPIALFHLGLARLFLNTHWKHLNDCF